MQMYTVIAIQLLVSHYKKLQGVFFAEISCRRELRHVSESAGRTEIFQRGPWITFAGCRWLYVYEHVYVDYRVMKSHQKSC